MFIFFSRVANLLSYFNSESRSKVGDPIIINLLFLAMIIYRDLNTGGVDLRILSPYGIFLLFLWTRARRLKRRVAVACSE